MTKPPTPAEQHRDREQSFWKRQIVVAWWLNGITAVAAVIAIGGLVLVKCSLDATKAATQATQDATETANRAWISVVTIDFKPGAPEKTGDQFGMVVPFRNVGGQPALHLAKAQEPFALPNAGVQGPNRPLSAFHIDPNRTCERVERDNVVGVLWPNKDRDYLAEGAEQMSIADANYFTGRTIIGYRGCITYETFGKSHRTGFCFVYTGSDPDFRQRHWLPCPGPDQNFAD